MEISISSGFDEDNFYRDRKVVCFRVGTEEVEAITQNLRSHFRMSRFVELSEGETVFGLKDVLSLRRRRHVLENFFVVF